MRVIAGKFKGSKLISPRGEVRPTTDLVKGSLFSMLEARGCIKDAACLDIFCGSGSLGIEALSRGARSCVFADENTYNVKVNLDKLGLTERMIKSDFRRALRMLKGEKFDLILCDPPYKSGFAELAIKSVVKYGLLGETGVMAVEYGSENSLIIVDGTCIIDNRTFGASAFEILRGDNESGYSRDV